MSDEELFFESITGVRPLSFAPRTVVKAKKKPRLAGEPHQNGVPKLCGQPLEPMDPWRWRVAGISTERMKRLAAGDYPPEMELDLHGKTRMQAQDALQAFFADAIEKRKRVLCLVHGRGRHSPGGKPVLRQAVYDWLIHGPYAGYILAVTPLAGNEGSCLVLLRRVREVRG